MQRRFILSVECPDHIPEEVVSVALEYVGQEAAAKFLELMDAYEAGRQGVAALLKMPDPAPGQGQGRRQ